MARSAAPNSVGSQFFIVLDDKDGAILSQANTYQIIGNVTSGMDVADAIYVASARRRAPDEPDPGHDGDRRQPLIQPPNRRGAPMTRATIATDLGDIEVELFDQSAPKATANFVKLADDGFYDDVIFHRVIPGFVAQAGDGQYGKKASLERGRVGTGGPGYKFEDEPV